MFQYKAVLLQNFHVPFIMIPSIDEARSGFWINHAGNFTLGEDRVTWIPPGQIKEVQFINYESNN